MTIALRSLKVNAVFIAISADGSDLLESVATASVSVAATVVAELFNLDPARALAVAYHWSSLSESKKGSEENMEYLARECGIFEYEGTDYVRVVIVKQEKEDATQSDAAAA